MSQWVQHISGQREKYRVDDVGAYTWHVSDPGNGYTFLFPKSEYILCDPPEVWEDVTEQCEVNHRDELRHNFGKCQAYTLATILGGYRLRKVLRFAAVGLEQWGFIVEKKKS